MIILSKQRADLKPVLGHPRSWLLEMPWGRLASIPEKEHAEEIVRRCLGKPVGAQLPWKYVSTEMRDYFLLPSTTDAEGQILAGV